MPIAIKIGIPYETFWKTNPRIIKLFYDDYERKIEEKMNLMEVQAWVNGIYVRDAILNALHGNKAKYPDNPSIKRQEALNTTPLTEEEKFRIWIIEFNSRFEKKSDSVS